MSELCKKVHKLSLVKGSLNQLHCSKNLKEHIHCGKLLVKRTILVFILRYTKELKLMTEKQSTDTNPIKNMCEQLLDRFGGCNFSAKNIL